MPSNAEIETRKRIRVSVAAYAYELCDAPIMSDAEYDALAASIDLTINTNRPNMDCWFIFNFKPFTGSWVQEHPELKRIGEIYETVFR